MLHIDLYGRTFCLHRPADLETVWEKMAEEELSADDRIPYWVELWPASIVLAKWLLRHEADIAGLFCLDLGCGLGLCTQAAASCQARVVGADYEVQALDYARYGPRNFQPWAWLGMDWRKPCLKPRTFPLIFGADILYETRFFSPLLSLWDHLLAPGGKIWITAPDREVSRPFWERILPESGWEFCCVFQEEVSFQSYRNMQISLWEISSQPQSRSLPG